MKQILALSFLSIISGLLICEPALADADNFQTKFAFTSIVDGKPTSYPTMEDKQVAMPAGSVWKCEKLSATKDEDDDIIGAFLCKSADTTVMISAQCNADKLDGDKGMAIISNKVKGKSDVVVAFVVVCKTERKEHTRSTDGLSL